MTISLRTLVALVVACVILPVWVYAVFVSWQYAASARAALEAEGQASVRNVSTAVQFRMNVLNGMLRTLEQSEGLKQNRLDELYSQASAFAHTQGVVIGLNDPGGKQIFNTNAPFKTPLPPALDQSRFRDAIEKNAVQVSDLIYGNVTRTWLFAMSRPVALPSGERAALIVAFDAPQHLGEILSGIHLPQDWAIAVIDGAGRIAARRPNPEFAGGQAPANVRALVAQQRPDGVRATLITGEPALVFAHPIENTAWSVVVGVPEKTIADSVKDRTGWTFILGLVIFLASVAGSFWIANRFTRKFEALSRLALAYRDRATAIVTRSYHVQELRDLQETLIQAHHERNRNESSLKELLAEKELLMQEVHHRVKNSLQLVRGVLSLQARTANGPELKLALDAAASRIITIANVHHHLYTSENVSEVVADDYFQQLMRQLEASLFTDGQDRRIRVKAPHVALKPDLMTNLGLVATELVTNSAKYGSGPIDVQFHVDYSQNGAEMAVLAVGDRGEGFPEGFSFKDAGGLGSRLIENLVRSANGTLEIQNRSVGSRVVVRVPIDPMASAAA